MLGINLLVGPPLAFGLTTDLTNDPAQVVRKYLSLDKRGARLLAQSWEVLKPYISWTDEPVWGQVVVITDFTVADDVTQWNILNSLEAVIPVRFRVVGIMQWETATFLKEPRVEAIGVHIKAIENHWRIVGPQFPPHVGRKRLADFVRAALLEETRPDRRARLERLWNALEQAPSP
ncbi:MAG: hypothetical protein D6704_08235 [Nitrospirae bacterium]|nr:MAG: hypothetical protein D6704_08235 [Nitrospirota bacterium]